MCTHCNDQGFYIGSGNSVVRCNCFDGDRFERRLVDLSMDRRPEPAAHHDCACTEFDDGSSFKLSGFAGGGSKLGAFSVVHCAHKKPDGSQEIILYIRDRDADIIGSILARSIAERRQFLRELVAGINGAERIEREERRDDRGHDCYETGDADAPESIKDRNGEVTLGLCRRCGRAEGELSEPCVCGPGKCKPECSVCARGDCPKETPADRLADVATEALDPRRPETWASDLADAIGDYRSTRNGVGATAAEVIGWPPDPIQLARLMLDAVTGGALSSLLCVVRDRLAERPDPGARSLSLGPADAENLRSNLRALGEKIED